MGHAATVRASRSGDRYHYLWASLRALRLLDRSNGLTVLSIEGPSEGDVVVGEEVVDIAEYYGGRNGETASAVAFYQLKHSSVRVDEVMNCSDLKNTLEKFAEIYRQAARQGRATQNSYCLVTNRRLGEKVRRTVKDLAGGVEPAHVAESQVLRRYLGFGADATAEQEFCGLFTIDDGSLGVLGVQRAVEDELRDYLPGGGTGSELAQLMDQIATMATYEAKTHTLDLHDLLVTLRTTERDLFPAMPELESPAQIIRTQDLDTVATALRAGAERNLLVTAHGGVGKSILAGTLTTELGQNSVTLVYDCFAGGHYRRSNMTRHSHRVALTQIANELASRGLCTSLIPSATAAPGQYLDAFVNKVQRACERLAVQDPDALVTVIIDAADNAAIAAAEFGERMFVADLFGVEWPANFRLVALCRPERVELLDLPAGVPQLHLTGFDRDRTLEHLRTRFPEATATQGGEFHVLSSGNPRVQAMAMEVADSASGAVAALGFARSQEGEALDALLADQIRKVAAQGRLVAEEQIRLCEALAALHPTVPLTDLAAISQVDIDAIRSFAVSLGRGLLLTNDNVQFRDEPTETWFRKNYRPDAAGMANFAARVAPLAHGSTYVSSVLPQIYFEAGMLGELVDLALSDGGLPTGADSLQAQEIARARTRFALAAALRARRHEEAALLAVKAGTLTSGHSRRMKMLRKNPDLAAAFLAEKQIEALCLGRDLTDGWPGSSLHVEAAMLSYNDVVRDLASARWMSSIHTMEAIFRIEGEQSRDLRSRIGHDEVVALALAITNLDGPAAGAEFLRGWKPKVFVRECTTQLAARLADAGRLDELSELQVAAAEHSHIQIGIAQTMFDYAIVPSDQAVASVAAMLSKRKKPFPEARAHLGERTVGGVVWIVLHAYRLGLLDDHQARRILEIHVDLLSDRAGEVWHGPAPAGALLGHALIARLEGRALNVGDVIRPEFFETLTNPGSSGDRDARSFNANIPDLIPWASCLVEATLDPTRQTVMETLRTLAHSHLTKLSGYETPFVQINGLAEFAVRLLIALPDSDVIEKFAAWHAAAAVQLTRSRLTVVRCAARSPLLAETGIAIANRAFELIQADRSDADQRVDDLIDVARAVLATSRAEAKAIFEVADAEAELVGDDLYARWYAVTNTAASLGTGAEPARAHRLLQIAEVLEARELRGVHDAATRAFAMDPTGFYAAVSRLRDRRAGRFESLLGPIFEDAATASGRIGALALYAFGPQVAWHSVTSKLNADDRERADTVYAEYSHYREPPGSLPGNVAGSSYESRNWASVDERQHPDPAELAGLYDFVTAGAWETCFEKLHRYTVERREFIEHALGKSPALLPDALGALAGAPSARSDDFLAAARFAQTRPSTAGLRAAITDLVTAFSHRFAGRAATRWYDSTELAEFAAACNVAAGAILNDGFVELGEQAHALTHEEYFALASHIARTLPAGPAGAVFDALTALFDDLAPPDTTGDGSYEKVAKPPTDRSQCLAGLIWAALGDMAIEQRWNAAHAVLLLVQLGDEAVLSHLAAFANGTHDASAYSDARFQPYSLHSRMWLLLSLWRSATEPNSSLLVPFIPWLVEVVNGPCHAVNQVLGQQILRLLADSKLDDGGSGEDALKRRVRAEWDELTWQDQQSRPDPLADGPDDDAPNSYPFFYDFEDYWCRHLARVFGTTEEKVADRAYTIASTLTGYDETAPDPRREAQIFNNESYGGHRTWQQEEDFGFYSAVHALLTLGAELAQSVRAYKEPETDRDEYSRWLDEFLPKRDDGRWLSDRRDPPPELALEWRIHNQEPDAWPWSLTAEDFARRADDGSGWIAVRASHQTQLRDMSEEVTISSALVENDVARSFLVALQTHPEGRMVLRLPTTDDHDQLDSMEDRHGRYVLRPWIDNSANSEGIDRHDPLGRDIRFPPPRPGAEIVERLNLQPDVDQRAWTDDTGPVFRSRVWDATEETGRESVTGTSGEILEVNAERLTRLLRDLDQTLALTVDIRRQTHKSSYQRKADPDDLKWLEWSSKVFLIDPRGQWTEY